MASEGKYAHGHHDTVLRSHRWRTAQNSAAYLLPHLKPDMKILDIGCGPGNITCDLASLVPQGSVIGMDRVESVVTQAQSLAHERGVGNVSFAVGDVFKLAYADGEFDVVHAHQVLQHLGDPTAALKEMRRVTKSGGIVAARDLSHALHWPETQELVDFKDIFWGISANLGTVPGIGCQFRKFTREAGFKEEELSITAGTWCYASKEELGEWCGMWADRVIQSEFHDNCIKFGLATDDQLQHISKAWTRHAVTEDAWYAIIHGEVIARVP